MDNRDIILHVLNWILKTSFFMHAVAGINCACSVPRPLLIFSQSDYLIQVVDINSHTECQAVQIQISWLLEGNVKG